MFSRIKGTQDFIDISLFNFIADTIKKHLKTYHYTEIATPILEETELFKRSLGLQTDVVTKEMFTIASRSEDKEASICLRPEATAAIARAFIENGIQNTPWKTFLYGPMFRYERPQKGRYRQFHQVSIEIIGAKSIAYDAELIKMLDRYFSEELTLQNYAILLNFIGCQQDRTEYKKILSAYLETPGISENLCNLCKSRKEKNILRIFDCKNPACQELYKKAPLLIDHICADCKKDWDILQEQLDLLGVTYTWCPTLVRGLDYYNKTVFEFVSENLGAQSAFCAGGRYDSLIAELGAKEDQPSVGAAIGMERLMLLLEPLRSVLPVPQPPALHVILPLSAEQHAVALILADILQEHNLCVDTFFDGDSMKSKMRKANKMGAAYCLIIGEDEQKDAMVTIKNMVTGEENRVPQSEALLYLKK